MANIDDINYDELVNGASKIASLANDMQNSIKQALQKMDTMRDVWFGQSYDNFVTAVNLQVVPLNKLFEVLVSDIPHEIAAKAKSYAASQQTTVGASFGEQTAIVLTEISKTNKGAELRFKTDQVTSAQQEIKSCFDKATESAESAKQIAGDLAPVWQSISGDTNIVELQLGFSRVIAGNRGLTSLLDGAITQQSNTIETIEGIANTVEAAKNAVSDGIDSAGDAINSFIDKAGEMANQTWKNLTGQN